jgi:hypothetical protein
MREIWVTDAGLEDSPVALLIYTVDMIVMFAVSITPQDSLLGAFPIVKVEPEYRQGVKLTQYDIVESHLKRVGKW